MENGGHFVSASVCAVCSMILVNDILTPLHIVAGNWSFLVDRSADYRTSLLALSHQIPVSAELAWFLAWKELCRLTQT